MRLPATASVLLSAALATLSLSAVPVAAGPAGEHNRTASVTTPAPTGPGAAKPGVDDLAGIIAMSECSAALVKFRNAPMTNAALMLTNGHCTGADIGQRFPNAGQVIVDRSANRSVKLLKADGSTAATLRANRIVYDTMTDTDAAIFRLATTYQDIKARYGIDAFIIAEQGPKPQDRITVSSGYWKKRYKCSMDKQVYRIREDQWTWKESVRYTAECDTPHGSSGSPVFGDASGEVVAVNNTGNDGDARACAMNNPCEVDEQGKVTSAPKGISYAQQTWWFTTCVNSAFELDLSVAGCQLPKPKRRP
ncbi:serine protease [Pilimelia columellifera]|uniref:Serine protease n=1 Tax=Pilimelia columellifera subsp. columellifera TaxID=706583 RepID=A0ABP6B0X7_9ACTN